MRLVSWVGLGSGTRGCQIWGLGAAKFGVVGARFGVMGAARFGVVGVGLESWVPVRGRGCVRAKFLGCRVRSCGGQRSVNQLPVRSNHSHKTNFLMNCELIK